MVSEAAVPVMVRKLVSVIVRVSVEESATGLVPAGTLIVSKELPPQPPVVSVNTPLPLSVSVPLDTSRTVVQLVTAGLSSISRTVIQKSGLPVCGLKAWAAKEELDIPITIIGITVMERHPP